MSIAWTESLALGDPVIDSDHRRMIVLIAALESAAGGGICLTETGRALAELSALCHEHFAREEDLQRRVGFPGHEDHALAHAMFLKRLDAVLAHFTDGDDEIRAGIARTLGDSLATWLLGHIANADMEFKPYMA